MQRGLINRESEPFSVRAKEFYDVVMTMKLLRPKFTETLGHEPDGLIFQPSVEVITSLISFIHHWIGERKLTIFLFFFNSPIFPVNVT